MCDYCQKKDHFANVCRKRLRDSGGKTVHTVAESEGSDNEADLLTFAVVVQQHQTPRSYIVATPDGTQMRRNRFHLQPTKEEAFPAPSPAWEAVASNESNPCMQPSTDVGIEMPEMESQPDLPQTNQPVRRSLRIRRPPQRLIETV